MDTNDLKSLIMEIRKTYENYPVRIILLSNIVTLSIYISGFLILHRIALLAALLYLALILASEYRLIKNHCTNCIYWNRLCGFGKGKLSGLVFKKGEPSRFCNKEVTWKDMIPDLLISLIPLICGIVLMIINFDIIILVAVLLIVVLTTAGNSFIRGHLTCRYCMQRELGCPAEKLFSKVK